MTSGFRKGGLVLVQDEDGFDIPVREQEIVLITPSAPEKEEPKAVPSEPKKPQKENYEEPTEEDIKIAQLKELYKKESKEKSATAQPVSPAKELTEKVQRESLEDRIIRLEMTVKRLLMRIERLEDASFLQYGFGATMVTIH